MSEPCECHPECIDSCRREGHPPESPCIWPDCLTPAEMRAALLEAKR